MTTITPPAGRPLIEPPRRQPMRQLKKASRCAALIAAMAAIVGGLQLATPPPASASSGLQRATPDSSPFDDSPAKSALAECPYGKHVIGGGASVSDGGRKLVRLTSLRPYSPPFSSSKDTFSASAEAPNLSRTFNWSVTAYAICADKSAVSNYKIVPGSPVTSSDTFQTTAARCPNGTVAYSAGASIITPAQGQIGLQLNRTSGPLDISRAAARESVNGYAGQWSLISYAVCARPQGEIHADGNIEPGAEATDYCDDPRFRTHGAGGGGGLTDGGPVWLQKIYPHYDLRGVSVALTGATYPSIGGVVAHETCAL